jgi:Flp pilus assembly protein TadD
VHPARLGRDESEAICARCHLRGAASVLLRGRQLDDFRPGQRLEDFRVDFVPRATSQIMKVVGHVEQMRASRCFQESDSLTCITCHDPHAPPTAEERIALYREKCNECHHEHCRLPREERLAADNRDDCIACHMPQRPTNLPHFAFTHHRIGVHPVQPGGSPSDTSVVDLVPIADLSHLPPLDRHRVLGLAYLEYAVQQIAEQNRRECLERAESLLESVAEGGLRDADVLAALAIMAWQREDLPRAERFATEAAAQRPFGSHAPANALLVLADVQMQRRDHSGAAQLLARLVELRRSSDDWILLGRVRGAAGDYAGAADALRHAAQIHPFRTEIHELLSGTYALLGDSAAARKHLQIGEALMANQPKSHPLSE